MTISLANAWLEDLDAEACRRLLRENEIGRLAVVVGEAPIVLPVNYRLVETGGFTWVAVRTRPGNILDRAPAFVALEIDAIDPIRHQGWSVLVRGTLQRVDPNVADFRARFDSEPWLASERDSWLVFEPFAITGRQLHAAESDWAFHPRAYL
jgi:nitroimidazol reductase NimA-like FMN-containing flavoprotein (pyridoxamine 5'-phosphate oxidase superfamily)